MNIKEAFLEQVLFPLLPDCCLIYNGSKEKIKEILNKRNQVIDELIPIDKDITLAYLSTLGAEKITSALNCSDVSLEVMYIFVNDNSLFLPEKESRIQLIKRFEGNYNRQYDFRANWNDVITYISNKNNPGLKESEWFYAWEPILNSADNLKQNFIQKRTNQLLPYIERNRDNTAVKRTVRKKNNLEDFLTDIPSIETEKDKWL